MAEVMLTMKLLEEKYGVCRLDAGEAIPAWATLGTFFSVTKTEDELSVVCDEDAIPEGLVCEKDWRILKVLGPLDFSLVGILASISKTLADCGVSIFAISTYDTDYILVKEIDIDRAVESLETAKVAVVEG
jgi:hypothetical protein